MKYVELLIPGLLFLVTFLVLGLILVRLYRRSTQEMALVRTGAGGLKVVMGGGILVLPGLHDLLRVNMKTMTITVDGGGRADHQRQPSCRCRRAIFYPRGP